MSGTFARRSGGVRRLLQALAVLSFSATPAAAWEAEFTPICTLSHEGADASVRVTYDPAIAEYAISITRERSWRDGPVFAMRFAGPRGNVISTDRHVLSEDRRRLTVTDSGFGNVLNGLEFNHTATALLGDQAVAFSLAGAAPEVRAFRACVVGLSV